MPEKKTAAPKKATAVKKDEKKEPVKAAKAAPAKAAPAKAAKAAVPKKAAPAKRAVARPVTRVVRPEPERAARPAAPKPAEKREKAPAKPLPTAPAGHAPLIAADGSVAGSLELPKSIATPAKRFATLFQAFLAERANARQATAATKNRARVKGGGAKPWRQKGTGRARQGSTRAPHWRHGGVVFGPNGRTYDQRIPEKMRKAAFAEAMSARVSAGRVLIIEDPKLDGDRPRTRDVVTWLGKIGDTGATIVVSSALDERFGRAMANLPELEYRTPGTLRLSEVLESDTLLVHKGALDALALRAGEGGHRPTEPSSAPATEAAAGGGRSRD